MSFMSLTERQEFWHLFCIFELRLSFSSTTQVEDTVNLVKRIEKTGIAAIAVHGR